MEEPERDSLNRIGAAIKARREALGLSQREAAALADGMSPTTWGQLERGRTGRPQGLTLAAVCRALRWPASAIEDAAEGRIPGSTELHELRSSLEHSLSAADDYAKEMREEGAEAPFDLTVLEERFREEAASAERRLRYLERKLAGATPEDLIETDSLLAGMDGYHRERRPAAASGLPIPEDFTDEERAEFLTHTAETIDAIRKRRAGE